MQTKLSFKKLLREMRPVVLPMNTKQSDRFLNWFVRHPSTEETEIAKDPIDATLIIFFDSQGEVHKELVPEGKTVNAEFCTGVMDPLLKRTQRVRPAAFCS
jgi:hypothetical protein